MQQGYLQTIAKAGAGQLDAEGLVALLMQAGAQPPRVLKLATVQSGGTATRPILQFDGEQTNTSQAYWVLAGVSLSAGQRVLVALVNNGGVVLGAIV